MDTLSTAMDIGYFAPGTTIVKVGEGSDFLHVIIKGAVEERLGDDVEAALGVRSDKAALSSGCKSHPANSLQPEAIGAVMEVTR